MPSLQGEEYLQDQQPAYGTQGNPAQAPVVEGGWGGLLISGATALAGIATDNPYAVAFGSDMGQSYHDSYDTLNKSLIDEQRANRLAESSLARQKNLATFNRDLTSGDRALAQENIEADRKIQGEQWKAGHDLDVTQEGRLGEQAKLDTKIKQKRLDELNKTPQQRAQEAADVAVIVKKAEMQVVADQTATANRAQQDQLEASLTELGVSPELIQESMVSLKLKQAGIELKGKQKEFTGEQKVKLQQQAKSEYMERPDVQARLATEPAKVEAEADKHGVLTAKALENSLNTSGGGGLAAKILADIKSGKEGGETESTKSDLGKAIAMFFKGQATDQQLMAGAKTKEEKAAVQDAINLRNREDAAPASGAALSGRLEAQAGAEEQAGIQEQFTEAPTPLAAQAAVNTAAAQGVEIDTGQEPGVFSQSQQRTIDRQVDNYTKADTKKKKKIIDNLRKNAPPELLKEVLRRVQ